MSKWTDWAAQRLKEKLCQKCSRPVCKRSKRFCNKHRLAHNRASNRAQKKNPVLAAHRSKISGHRARVRVMQVLGGLFCSLCKEDDYRVLTIDHVNGHQVAKKKRKARRNSLTPHDAPACSPGIRSGGTGNYELLKQALAGKALRVLCCNCQARHEHARGNRVLFPETIKAVLEAGGKLPGVAVS